MKKTQPLKIAVLLPDIEPWSRVYGGAVARYSMEMIKFLPPQGYEVMVFAISCRTEAEYPFAFTEPRGGKFTIWLEEKFRNLHPSLAGWCYIFSMYRRIRKYDIIQIHNRPHFAMILRRLGYKGKIINHLNNDFAKSSPEFAKRFVDASDLVLSCSQKIADRLFDKYPEGLSKSDVQYNGANPDIFSFGNHENRQNKILFVGRIDEIKGVHNLISAFNQLKDDYPDWQLLLAGSATFGAKKHLTPYEKTIQQLIESANIKREAVKHLGYVDHNKLPELFQHSAIFSLPSIVHDAFPFVIIEAMFCGIPIVASNMGGIPEAVVEFGELCEPNADDLKRGLQKVMNDPELRKTNGLKLHERAINTFSWEKLAERQYEIYDRLMDKE